MRKGLGSTACANRSDSVPGKVVASWGSSPRQDLEEQGNISDLAEPRAPPG